MKIHTKLDDRCASMKVRRYIVTVELTPNEEATLSRETWRKPPLEALKSRVEDELQRAMDGR